MGDKKIHEIEYIATHDQTRMQSRQPKDAFKEFITVFKQMLQDDLAAPRRTIKQHGYAYPFLMILLRWGLAFFQSDMKQVHQGAGVLMLPCPFGADKLIANRAGNIFKRTTVGEPKALGDIRIGLAL